MTPLTIGGLWERSLELYFCALKHFAQGILELAQIVALHVRFAAVKCSDGIAAAREWIDLWQTGGNW